MATLVSTVMTLGDWGKKLDPKGQIGGTIELLSQTNAMIQDALFKEGNLVTGEQTSIRVGLPTVYYRLLNQGTPTSKSATVQVTENTSILEAWSEIDVEVAKLTGNIGMARMDEALSFLEAMNQTQQETLLYGSASNPEEYVGFMPRYSDTTAVNGQNIILAGGSGADNASVLLVGWGQRTVFSIFPKGSKAGIDHQDHGEVTIQDTVGIGGTRMRAFQEHWTWKTGLCIKDWRYVVRIANIDISTLIADSTGATINLLELMLGSIHHIPNPEGVKLVFYCNRTIGKMLDVQAMNKSNMHLSVGKEEGEAKVMLRGIPIRTVDRMTIAEALVA